MNSGNSRPKSANRRLLPRDDQPLRPRSGGVRWLVVLSIILVITALTIPNRESISRYLNRSVEVVKITTPLNRVGEGEVTRLLAAYMQEGFFKIDVTGVKHQLETHPWIARAEVKRVWPDAVAIAIVEEIAIARWGSGSLVNQYGEIFTPARLNDTNSLPLLSGPEGSEARVMEQYQAFNQILYATGLRIEKLILSDRSSWELEVSGGLRLVAGKSGVRDKLKRFAAIYDKQIGNDIADIEKIDLRYSNGFTVKKRHLELSEVASW